METNTRKMCQKLPKEDCEKKENCIYTTGTKRKYCRVKNNTKNTNKNLTKKITPSKKYTLTKEQAQRGKEMLERRNLQEKEVKAREIIGRFMKRTKHTRKSAFLKSICADSGLCLAFGTRSDEIKKHFGGFVNFEYAIAPIKRIGNPSANGFISEIQYKHNDYIAYAVLKSSMKADSDNLMYEYLVGQYVNKLNKQFPCFLETYGYYTYNNNKAWAFLKDTKVINNMDSIKNNITLQKTTDYAIACIEAKRLTILIQHLKGILPIKKMMHIQNFVKFELLNVLFQIYMPLAVLKDTFTHYDLHDENVNLYEPIKDSYIYFHYNIKGVIYSFKSKYVAKIIDYGRSYFNDTDSDINSKKIYNELCKKRECRPNCGYSKGFAWLEDRGTDLESAYWISSQKRNKSHDLRLLNIVKQDINYYKTRAFAPIGITTLLDGLRYDNVYGTPELNNGYPQINNVSDALKMLMFFINTPGQIQRNEIEYTGKSKLADLYIYDDGSPMRFVKA